MMRFNLFYAAVVILGLVGLYFFNRQQSETESFYGLAESNDTYINYNYPVVVQKLYVVDGQAVQKGDTLMTLARIKAKEVLADQSYRIAELKAQETIWLQKNKQQLKEIELETQAKLDDINQQIVSLEKQKSYKQSIAKDLNYIKLAKVEYQPINDKIASLRLEKKTINEDLSLKQDGINTELKIGKNPYREQIKKLEAEIQFDESQKIQYAEVLAPQDGLIGQVSCKEGEHIPSFQTLMRFYEPHSGTIKGYVHEDMKLNVQIGDQFRVASLQNPDIFYLGHVVGLGSRIVEIPSRLRKIVELKTYGREVIIEITRENSFLQKEKVSIYVVESNPSTDD